MDKFVEFIRTRNLPKWLAFSAWVLLMSAIVYADIAQGKIELAIFEALCYTGFFIFVAWYSYNK